MQLKNHSIKTGNWQDLGTDAAKVRLAVFVQEQGIPLEMEWDEADARCLHAVIYSDAGVPLATGRLLPSEWVDGHTSSHIGRMAVMPEARGQGLGRAVLQALMAAAHTRDDTQIVLHAQTSAEDFYAKQGFIKQGAPYAEVGIAHQDMVCVL